MQAEIKEQGQDYLMWRMTQGMGLDLAAAVRWGFFPVDSLNEMLRTCEGCREPGLCRVYLDSRPDHIATAPSYCPNRSRLTKLQETLPIAMR